MIPAGTFAEDRGSVPTPDDEERLLDRSNDLTLDRGRRTSVISNGSSAFDEFIDPEAVEQPASATPVHDQSPINLYTERRTPSFPNQTNSPPSTRPTLCRRSVYVATETPSGSYRIPQILWYTAKFQPQGSLSSLPAELWLEIIRHLDIRSTEHLLAALFFLLRALGICTSTVRGRAVPHVLAWLRNGGALYEILAKYPCTIAEDIFSQLSGQDKVTLILTLYTLDKRYPPSPAQPQATSPLTQSSSPPRPTKQTSHLIKSWGFEFLLPFHRNRWSHGINKHYGQGRMRDWEMFENEQWSVERAADGRKGSYVRVWKKARPKPWRSR